MTVSSHISSNQVGLSTASDGSNSRKTVYVIDDDVDVRKSLHYALSVSEITVWPFGSPEDFLEELDSLPPAPIIIDVRMPKIDGLQLLEMVRKRGVNWPVIMMTAHGDIPIAVAATKLGAVDFLEKPFDLDVLEDLLEQEFPKIRKLVLAADQRDEAQKRLAKLTPRESEVIELVANGYANRAVAEKLKLSPRTVEVHRAAALAKLAIKSTTDLVRLLARAEKESEMQLGE